MRVAAFSAAVLLAAAIPSGAQDTTRTARLTVLPLIDDSISRRAHRQSAAGEDLAQLLERHLYPPDLIMRNQTRLRITEQQRTAITGEIARLQAAAVQMQWGVMDETQKLVDQLQQATISEEQALAQVDRLIGLETAVKRAQLTMLIRIRNALTPAQREMLRDLRTGRIR
jgi:hypothetical protein